MASVWILWDDSSDYGDCACSRSRRLRAVYDNEESAQEEYLKLTEQAKKSRWYGGQYDVEEYDVES